MKNVIAILIFFVFFAGCKTSQKVATESSVSAQKNIANDITSSETLSIDEAVQRSVEKLKSGKYGIVINRVEYDTDKPADTITGKSPIKSDTKMTVTAQEEIKEAESTTSDRKETASSELSDKTVDKSKIQAEEQTKTERELSRIEILVICSVAALFIILVIYIIRKFKK